MKIPYNLIQYNTVQYNTIQYNTIGGAEKQVRYKQVSILGFAKNFEKSKKTWFSIHDRMLSFLQQV